MRSWIYQLWQRQRQSHERRRSKLHQRVIQVPQLPRPPINHNKIYSINIIRLSFIFISVIFYAQSLLPLVKKNRFMKYEISQYESHQKNIQSKHTEKKHLVLRYFLCYESKYKNVQKTQRVHLISLLNKKFYMDYSLIKKNYNTGKHRGKNQ